MEIRDKSNLNLDTINSVNKNNNNKLNKEYILSSINQCLTIIRDNEDIKIIIHFILTEILEICGSKMGFVNLLKYNQHGSPFFRNISFIGKEMDKFINFYQKHINNTEYIDFYNMDTLYGLVYTTGELVISNDVCNDKRRGGKCKLPPNHPALKNFMGVPIKRNDNIIGMIGLANFDGEYNSQYLEIIESYIVLIGFVIVNWNQQQKINYSRNRFLLHMSHEIKTPLNGIIGMTQHLLDTMLNDEQMDILLCISKCNFRLFSLINDIGDFYKLTMGEIDLNPETINIDTIIDNVFKLYEADIEEKKLEFEINIPSEFPQIITDSKRLTQVLINIISNAVKFTIYGKISLDVNLYDINNDDSDNDNIFNRDIKIIEINVCDTGIGMDSHKLDGIFKEFYNLDNGFEISSETGRGLGLSISKLIMDVFGGNIVINSEKNVGTKVTISFPVEINKQNKDIIKNLLPLFTNTYSILFVDNIDTRIKLSTVVSKLNSIPLFVNSVEEIKPYIDNNNINIIIMFVSENFSNTNIVHDIKQIKENIMVIIISNNKPTELFDDTIDNDFRFDDLINKIHNYYQKRNFGKLKLNESLNFKNKNKYKSLINNVNYLSTKISNPTKSLKKKYMVTNNKTRILIVEDEIANQKVLYTLLLKLGYSQIKIASNGQTMVDFMKKEEYDIVFIDIKMPIKDGYTATIEIVKHYTLNNINMPLLIAVTALEDFDLEKKCQNIGINYILKKPYAFSDIEKIMNRVSKK